VRVLTRPALFQGLADDQLDSAKIGHVVTQATRDDLAVAAAHSVDPARWRGLVDELMLRIGARFRRVKPRGRARSVRAGPRASWDADLRGYVAGHLIDPDGMLVVDETGDVKEGT
jgi:hypothetical protein